MYSIREAQINQNGFLFFSWQSGMVSAPQQQKWVYTSLELFQSRILIFVNGYASEF